MEKIRFTQGGQWSIEAQPLRKTADAKAPEVPYQVPTGTHTVEVHPDMDNLYRIKGAIQESGKPHIKKGALKQQGFDSDFLKKVPDDGHGLITPDMIDKHIASLPKHKVNVDVDDYTWGSQQHREGPQKVFSVQMHPDSIDKMKKEDPKAHEAWEAIKGNQHKFGDDKEHQLGWGRIDLHSKPGHWHVDEIQSDFQNHDKLKSKADELKDNIPQKIRDFSEGFGDHIEEQVDKRPDKEALNEKLKPFDHSYEAILHAWENKYDDWSKHHTDAIKNLENEGIKVDDKWKKPMSKEEWDQAYAADDEVIKNVPGVLKHLSGNHEDPQHLIHSVINELARKHNVKSTSMDMPVDQIIQSGLSNPHTKPAIAKIGGPKVLQDAVASAMYTSPEDNRAGLDDLLDQYKGKLSPEEHKTLKSMGEHLLEQLPASDDMYRKHSTNKDGSDKEFDEEAHNKEADMYAKRLGDHIGYVIDQDHTTPVHQRDTYDKRPKKLGMKPKKKSEVMGNHWKDEDDDVQYSKVYKSLQAMVHAARIHKDEEKLSKALDWIEKLRKQGR